MARSPQQLLKAVIVTVLFLVFLPLFLVVIVLCLPFMLFSSGIRTSAMATGQRRFRRLKTIFGWGFGVRELARRLDVSESELMSTVPVYRSVSIAKRSGGTRRLSVPDRRTRDLQQRLLRRVLARLRAHPAACGFERGKSIVHNAAPHARQAIVINADIVDFFPATTADRVEWYFRSIGWNRKAAALLTELTTHDGGLPQGAPTSPRLSNLVNYFLDVQLARFAERRKGQYTRYADDITISFPKDYPRHARGAVQKIRRLLKAHGYEMHRRRKLSIRRSHQRQTVTGLVVNDGVRLPRKTRRWLRAVRHHAATGRSTTLSPAQLNGWTALEAMVRRQAPTPTRTTN